MSWVVKVVQNFFHPVTFAWGLICILVHCAGMLLLLLAGLYYPDKTWSFKRFGAFAVLPLLFFFLHGFFPFPFLGYLFIFSPQSFSVWNSSVSSQSYLFSCFVPFVNLTFVPQSGVY